MENFDRKGFVYRKDWTYIPIKTNTKQPAVKEYKSTISNHQSQNLKNMAILL